MTSTNVMPAPAGAPAAPSGSPPAPAQASPPARDRWRRLRVRTVPGRIRAFAVVSVIAIAVLFGVTTLAIGHARDGLRVIGEGAGPQVVTTTNLYFALSDMDTQIANVLLIGRDGLGQGRDHALALYEQRRGEASDAIVHAAHLAAGDDTAAATVRSVLDRLGEYERLAAQALQLNDQAPHAAGPPRADVIRLYRQAGDVMRLKLLPQAYNLALSNGTTVRRTYEKEHSSVLRGRIWVGAAGVVTLAVLVLFQIYLTRRFRRVVNPAIALSTVAVLVLTVLSVSLLSREAEDLRAAKEDGFNSVISLSQARAISNSMHGDQSRYLLDPDKKDTYEQVYLDKSKRVLYAPDSSNLDKYYAGLTKEVAGYPEKDDFLGFFGDEAQVVTTTPQRSALAAMLRSYQKFQQDDKRLRQLVAAGQTSTAITHTMGALSDNFEKYDQALVKLTDLHRKAFDTAIRDGGAALGGWNVLLPVAALVAAALVLVGVGPRLSEYR